ncbi:unnamed protein product, partial [Prunus brigantina]
MTSLRKEMAKLQEHNNLLSSKVDETQPLLNQQETQNIQVMEPSQSLQTPDRQKKGKKGAKGTPAPSKQLVVPAPRDQPHVPKKVYTDCRHRINEKEAERQRSPIRINARLRGSRLKVLGDKSPLRKFQGLESERIQKMEDDRTRSQEPDWGKLRLGHFTERIKKSRQDREVQPLHIPFYTSVEDPLTHLHSFQSTVGCKGLSDEGQCLLFPSSLTEAALNWFYRLEPGTVDSFDELKQIFLNHFMIQTDRLYSADDLYTIRQREDEPLREYAARFSHEYPRTAYDAFKSGLRSSHFRRRQSTPRLNILTPSPGLQFSRGNQHRRATLGGLTTLRQGTSDCDNWQGSSKKGRGKYGRNDHRASLPNHDRAREVFTLLNTTYEAVLMNEDDQIPKPNTRKPNRQDNWDTGKFCRYHQQNSHNTEDCISLRKIVERLIREGKLDQYIARPPQAPAPNANRQINMISTISGGPTLAGPLNRSVKQYV